MENVTNSLKIAFAIIMLVLAITLTFSIISQAKATADTVFFAYDETNFYDMSGIKTGDRVVKKDTVISTLYRLYDESLCIKIENANSEINGEYDSEDYRTRKEADEKISEVCQEILKLDKNFSERYQEIKKSGEYVYADDGSEITLTPGGTKIYITYTYNNI